MDEALLADAYPRARDRERAVRWLGWVAYHWRDEPVAWSQIPGRLPGRWLAGARFAARALIVIAALSVAISFTLWVAVVLLLLLVAGFGGRGLALASIGARAGAAAGSPRELARWWPLRRRHAPLIALSLVSVIALVPVLVSRWTFPAQGEASRTYRADRLVTAARLGAWLASGGLVAAIAFAAGAPAGPWLGADLALAAGAGLLAALRGGPYPQVKLAELILAAQWRAPAGLHRELARATRRQVLAQSGGRWAFRDQSLRAALAAAHEDALTARARARQERAARETGARARLLARLDKRGQARARADLAAGAVIFVVATGATIVPALGSGGWWASMAVFTVLGMVAGALGYWVATWALRGLMACVRWTVVDVAPFARRTRLAAGAVAVAAAGALIATAGPALAGLAAAVLPTVLVLMAGAWAAGVTRRARFPWRWPGLRPGGAARAEGVPAETASAVKRRGWRRRRAVDVVVAVTAGVAALVLVRPEALSLEPAAGLLFPVAAWVAWRLWRVMNDSERLAVRAGADIAASLLLGADLVAFLAWLADLLGLTRAELGAVRGGLERAGSLADLPWWAWTGLYGALALLAVAFVAWPSRLRRAIGWSARARVVAVAGVARRVLTSVHIGLLVIVLLALAGPPAVFPVLRGQLAARYTVAYQRQLEEAGEQAAYTEIIGQFTGPNASHPVLASIVVKVHRIDRPAPGEDHATATEEDIARRVGQLQAAALPAGGAGSVAGSDAGAATAAGFAGPIRDGSDLRGRATAVDAEDDHEDAAAKRAEQAGDLAAATIASLLNVPGVGRSEVVDVVREYLQGLVEESPLKDSFAAWVSRLAGAEPPPDASTLVDPQPERLEVQALEARLTESAEHPRAATLPGTEGESPVDAAVDLVNQARFLAEDGTGPCAGCTRIEPHDDEPGHEPPVEDHPVP
ncbi:MAG TPA: hypothetical protein VH478_17590 [Trebonia sp.]|nr:hypothetical protein [Trebonia sp.]